MGVRKPGCITGKIDKRLAHAGLSKVQHRVDAGKINWRGFGWCRG